MRGLAGDFATMPLKDLVVYLGNHQVTGTLVLEREGIRKEVLLETGVIVNASSNVPREFLGQFLINLGHISEDQFERAYDTQKETKVFIGRILVMIGLITEETLQVVLAMKFRETILDAFNWADGTFAYSPNAEIEKIEGLQVQVSLLDIHKEADFRVQAWEEIRSAFPRGDVTLTLDRDMLVDPPRPGSIDEKLFEFIEEGQTLDEMALRLHATDFFLYNRLYAFFRLGALIVNVPREEIGFDVDFGVGENPSSDDMLEEARDMLSQGNVREAYALARRSNQLSATSKSHEFLKQIESAWWPKLKKELLTSAKVPVLAMSAERLGRLPLSAPERYLLSRVDGKRDVGAIIRVAPLKEFEALAFFDRFASSKWLKWAPS